MKRAEWKILKVHLLPESSDLCMYHSLFQELLEYTSRAEKSALATQGKAVKNIWLMSDIKKLNEWKG